MPTATRRNANMLKLVILYVAVFVMATCIGYGIMQVMARMTGQGMPVSVMLLIVPMCAAMAAAKVYVRDAGRKAGFGYTLIFGVLTAALVVLPLYLALDAGLLDGPLHQVDPYAMENGMKMRVYMPVMVLVGGLALFTNVLMFWAGTVGEAKRMRKLAEKEAAKRA